MEQHGRLSSGGTTATVDVEMGLPAAQAVEVVEAEVVTVEMGGEETKLEQEQEQPHDQQQRWRPVAIGGQTSLSRTGDKQQQSAASKTKKEGGDESSSWQSGATQGPDEEEELSSSSMGFDSSPSAGSHQASSYRLLEWTIERLEVKGGGGSKAGGSGRRKTLLQGLVGRTESGEFTAIMGPSGAGKTTLIECLCLRNREFEGALHLDGRSPGGDYFTTTALVHQKELLFGFLTVREHLHFHAVTKMANLYSPQQIAARIEAVLREVNLVKCADTIIGGTDPMFLHKGLSGGERKRLIIGTELLLCPSLLFLDEPTSGLDSVMAESVVASLRELANRGVVVMASIHSPNSEMVNLFTHMVLLTGDGRLAFHGRMKDALQHFETLGHALPKAYSPTDFFLRIVSKDSDSPAPQETARLDALVAAWRSSSLNLANLLPAQNSHKHFSGVHGLRVSWWGLFKLNVWRGLLQTRRDLLSFGLWGVAMTVIGFIFGILYLGQANDNWRNLMGLLFSTCVAILFTAAIANMVRFPLEWTVVAREYLGGSNAMGPYIAAKLVYDLPYCYGPCLLAIVLYWMTGMDPSAWTFVQFTLVIMLVNQASTAIGLFISSFSGNPLIGLALIPAVITPMIMFSGILYQRSTMPAYLSWMERLSIVNYGFSAVTALQLHILPPEGQRMLVAFTEVRSGDLHQDVAMLLVICAAGYLLTYANLRLRLALSSTNL